MTMKRISFIAILILLFFLWVKPIFIPKTELGKIGLTQIRIDMSSQIHVMCRIFGGATQVIFQAQTSRNRPFDLVATNQSFSL